MGEGKDGIYQASAGDARAIGISRTFEQGLPLPVSPTFLLKHILLNTDRLFQSFCRGWHKDGVLSHSAKF